MFLRSLALVAVAAVALESPVHAQSKSSGISLSPRFGWFIPFGSLGVAGSASRFQDATLASENSAPAPAQRVKLEGGFLIGATATFDVTGVPVVWRVDVDHAPQLGVRTNQRAAGYDAARTMVTAGIVTRARGHIRPYILAGIGFRAYRFKVQRPGEENGLELPPGGVNVVGRFGAGIEVDAGPVSFGAEGQSLPSTFRFGMAADSERTFQNDLAATIGLRIRVF
jgi:hypothetical protein